MAMFVFVGVECSVSCVLIVIGGGVFIIQPRALRADRIYRRH
jgi:hypothetical protein